MRLPATKQRQRPLDRSLVRLAEIAERRQRHPYILPVAEQKRIEAAARKIKQLVAQHIAGGITRFNSVRR